MNRSSNKKLTSTQVNKQNDNNEQDLEDKNAGGAQPITSSNSDLRYRLYDKGFNIRTMPSVKRPVTAKSQERPLSAKLYSLKNKLTVTTLQPQSTILHSGWPSKPQTSTKALEYDMGGSNMVSPVGQYKNIPLSQLNFGQQPPIYESNGNRDPYSQFDPINPVITESRSQQGFRKKSPPLALEEGDHRPTSRGVTMYRPTSTNSLATLNPLNKLVMVPSPNSIQTPQGKFKPFRVQTATHGLRSQGMTSANFFSPRSETHLNQQQTINPNLALSGEEFQQSKTVIDKMAGKHAIDPRYLISRPARQQVIKGTANMMESEMRNTITEGNDGERAGSPGRITQQDFAFERNAALQKQNTLEAPKRAPSNLDKYIELILKNVTNVDEFMYLLKNKNSDVAEDDPYDLRVIDYKVLKEENPKDYYTISFKGLCHYQNGKPIEFISLAYWLKERETYDKIKSLSFFVNFRRWKTLKMWRRNLNKIKTMKNAKALEEKLFIVHPILSKTLRNFRSICCQMEQLRFIDLTKKVEIQDLEHFDEQQKDRREFVKESILEFSKLARENVREGFKLCLDELRKAKPTSTAVQDYARKDGGATQGGVLRLKESAYENLGFPDNMDYERRSQLRRECSRFIRFSYLLDFLALNALSTIYNESINDLVKQLNLLNTDLEILVYKGESQMFRQNRDQEPLFLVKLDFDRLPIPSHAIYEEEIEHFALPPHGHSKIEDFNVLGHIRIEEPFHTDEELTDVELEKRKIDWENRPIQALRVQNISQYWLSITPNLDTINSKILKSIAEGMKNLQVFERWTKHDELTPYANVLEEWDDTVGDNWTEPDSKCLDPQDWIDVDAYANYGRVVRNLLEMTFNKADSFTESFNTFLEYYWRNIQLDYNILKSEKLVTPADTIGNLVGLLKYQKEHFEKNLPHTADIGLLRITCGEVKDKILPNPGNILRDISKILPEVLRHRIEEIKTWLNNSTIVMKSVAVTIEDFVKQSKALDQINGEFPSYKERLDIADMIYSVLDANEIEVKKEDKQKKTETRKYQAELQNVLMVAEERKEKYLEKFRKELVGDNGRIPKMNIAIADLQADVMDPKFLTKELPIDQAISQLENIQRQFKVQEDLSKEYNVWEQTLGLTTSSFDNVKSLKQEIDMRLLMWKSLQEWKDMTVEWMTCKFKDINAEQIKNNATNYDNICKRCAKRIQPNPVLDELRLLVFEFKESVPVVVALRNPRLTKDHIEEIKAVLEKPDLDIEDEDLTLRDLLDMNIVEKSKEINEISTQATQEANLAAQIKAIEDKWKVQELGTRPHKDEMLVIGDVEEVQDLLDQSLASTINILGSRYLKREREHATKLLKDLQLIQDTLDEWLTCQKNWMYLENIFRASDIKGALKKEAQQFDAIDKFFKKQMTNAARARLVQRIMAYPEVLKKFKEANEALDKIQKELEDYLRMKRDIFPRFYFLSNDELLEILANVSMTIMKINELIMSLLLQIIGLRSTISAASPQKVFR